MKTLSRLGWLGVVAFGAVFAEDPPTLTVVGGNNQFGYTLQFNAEPFDIALWDSTGTTPIVGAAITFSVSEGSGLLAESNTGSSPLATSLTLFTDADGTAHAYYRQPSFPNILSEVTVTSGTAQIVFQTRSVAPGDNDGDGISDMDEYLSGTNPLASDTDSDGMPDGWEVEYGLDPVANDAGADPDGDGATSLQEYQRGRNPASGVVADTNNAVELRLYQPSL